jgi:hypothetical protein
MALAPENGAASRGREKWRIDGEIFAAPKQMAEKHLFVYRRIRAPVAL